MRNLRLAPRPPWPRRHNQILAGLALAAATFYFSSEALPQSLNHLRLEESGEVPATPVYGLTEITIAPPFDGASVTLLINDSVIATRVRPPYNFDVDLGDSPVERKLTVQAFNPKKRMEWSRTINRGRLPLTIALSTEGSNLLAKTTSSIDDPIVTVEFFDGSARLASLNAPPWSIPFPTQSDLVVATARTRKGVEVAATWSKRNDVHSEAFDVRTVPLFVSVTDQNGAARVDLTSRDFRIYDKGREAKVLEFGKAFDQPVSIAVLLDASASMTNRMRDAANAADRFVSSIRRPGDQLAVFSIQGVPRRVQPLTTDTDAVLHALKSIEAGGETALYDALGSAIRELRDQKVRKAIVVLSDGADTASNRSFDELLSEARGAAIPIYVIAFSEGTEEEARILEPLRYLATETGGFLVVADAARLDAKYREIANDLRAQYAIRYEIADNSAAGEWRPIRVVVNSPRLSARTIRGYFAP